MPTPQRRTISLDKIRSVTRKPANKPLPVSPFDNDDVQSFIPELKALTKQNNIDPEALEQLGNFRETMVRLRKQAGENLDFRADAHTKALLQSMLATVLEMLPTAAQTYMQEKKESTAYAVNALMGKSQELLQALRSFDNQEEQVDYIFQNIFMRAQTQTAQQFVPTLFNAKNSIDNYKLPLPVVRAIKESMDLLVRSMIEFMQAQAQGVESQLREYLTGQSNLPVQQIKQQRRAGKG